MLISTDPSHIDGVAKKLLPHKMVENVHELYGEWDIIVKINGKNPMEVEDFIREKKVGRQTFYSITDDGVKFLSEVNKLKKISEAFGVPL